MYMHHIADTQQHAGVIKVTIHNACVCLHPSVCQSRAPVRPRQTSLYSANLQATCIRMSQQVAGPPASKRRVRQGLPLAPCSSAATSRRRRCRMLCEGELAAAGALRRRASPSSDGDMYSRRLRRPWHHQRVALGAFVKCQPATRSGFDFNSVRCPLRFKQKRELTEHDMTGTRLSPLCTANTASLLPSLRSRNAFRNTRTCPRTLSPKGSGQRQSNECRAQSVLAPAAQTPLAAARRSRPRWRPGWQRSAGPRTRRASPEAPPAGCCRLVTHNKHRLSSEHSTKRAIFHGY